MAEHVDNLILAQLRGIRAQMSDMRAEMTREFACVRADIRGVDAKVDGVSLLLVMLAGHVHGLDTRIERLGETRG
jgi:hypothetical protein